MRTQVRTRNSASGHGTLASRIFNWFLRKNTGEKHKPSPSKKFGARTYLAVAVTHDSHPALGGPCARRPALEKQIKSGRLALALALSALTTSNSTSTLIPFSATVEES
jgi:hypothetical protein